MFDRLTIFASDAAASRAGYAAISDREPSWADFAVEQSDGESSCSRDLHIAFRVRSRERVDAAWDAALAKGFRDDGEPGPRPQYSPGYYGAFALDPDGNSAEAMIHEGPHPVGIPRLRGTFLAHADECGYRLKRDEPDWVIFAAPKGSLSLRPAESRTTENVRIAFPGGWAIEL